MLAALTMCLSGFDWLADIVWGPGGGPQGQQQLSVVSLIAGWLVVRAFVTSWGEDARVSIHLVGFYPTGRLQPHPAYQHTCSSVSTYSCDPGFMGVLGNVHLCNQVIST